MGDKVVTTFAPGTLLMAALLTVLTSSQGLLTTASKTNGRWALALLMGHAPTGA
jgi:hypothetical protein